MLAQGGCASISHWLGKTGSFRNYTLIGQDFKTAQSMWKNFKNISAILKLPNQCMETTQSMWNACSKHFTLIGIYSPKFKNISAISKLPNQCMETTQSMWNACSKHFTLIGLYISKISRQFQNCLINVWKLPNLCEMLAASIPHWLGCIFKKFIANFKTA